MKYLITIIAFVLFSLASTAQEATTESIDNRFEEVVDGANDFKEYKVIKKSEINNLRREVAKYSTSLNDKIAQLGDTITDQRRTIKQLRDEVSTTDQELVNVNAEKDSMNVMGIQTSKSAYHTVVWSIIGALALALVIFIMKFKSSNTTTRNSLKQLRSTEEELEDLRKRSIEKEQKLGRQLQDERNKLARLKSEK